MSKLCVNQDGRPAKSSSEVLCQECLEELKQKWEMIEKELPGRA